MTSDFLHKFLKGKIISKENYDDLKIVIETVGENKKVLEWFTFIHTIEIVGWRPKLVTQKLARLLANSSKEKPIKFYALFCPSYKKGIGESGFRTDGVGETTKRGIKNLGKIYEFTILLGFKVHWPTAIFFDLALEQPEKVINKKDLADLEKNIANFKKELPKEIQFMRLSKMDKNLTKQIGLTGCEIKPLPVSLTTFRRIVERGEKFYQLFGWSREKIMERSRIIASSESLVGEFLRKKFKNGIMVYTPTMLERAQVYSGRKYNSDPLAIIFPRHDK